MNFKQLIIPALILLISIAGKSQNISVKSFKKLPNDMDARVHEPVIDQNGEKSALIKVVTTEKGFVWEGGTLGITEVKNKAGEYWVYVPHGAKKITIKHDNLGVLRDYIYPEAIKKATVYEMELTTGEVKTVVEEEEISSAYLIINSQPEDADVYIDDKYRGNTPFSGRYRSGEHTYRLSKSKYHPKAGKVEISQDEGRKELNINLEPNFGSLSVESEPESGMQIFIDEENTDKTTPATIREIESGTHEVTLKSKWYQPKTKKVNISDEQTTNLSMNLTPVYGKVNIQTEPASSIYIDGEKVGHDSYEGKVIEGIHTFSAKEDHYKEDRTEKEIVSNEEVNINLSPTPEYGKLDVSTKPMNASIILNGKDYGKTPKVIKELLVGDYKLLLKKSGYADKEKQITIREDETVTVEGDLAEGKEVTTTSKSKKSEYLTDPRDGKKYETVQIGSQVWMAENLTYNAEDSCWAYNNNPNNGKKYGYLYNWKTAQDVCPDGWHLPSDDEWSTLEGTVDSKYTSEDFLWNNTGNRGYDAGEKLKATSGWSSNGNGTNDYGFTALPGGHRNNKGSFLIIGKYTGWWTSTESSSSTAYSRGLFYGSSQIERNDGNKNYGFSVRCVKDE